LEVGWSWGCTTVDCLDLRIVLIEGFLWLGVLVLGVGLVRVFAFSDCLGYPRSVPFRVLNLLLRLGIRWSPNVDQVKEGCSGIEGHRRLLRDFVGFDDSLGAVQPLLGELLDVGLPCCVVGDCVFVCVFLFGLDHRIGQILFGYLG
jgi:hypothetical protein